MVNENPIEDKVVGGISFSFSTPLPLPNDALVV